MERSRNLQHLRLALVMLEIPDGMRRVNPDHRCAVGADFCRDSSTDGDSTTNIYCYRYSYAHSDSHTDGYSHSHSHTGA